MVKKINLNINGMEVKADEGDKLLAVAKKNGIEIPHLCHNERLDPLGACRMCVVEIGVECIQGTIQVDMLQITS